MSDIELLKQEIEQLKEKVILLTERVEELEEPFPRCENCDCKLSRYSLEPECSQCIEARQINEGAPR